MVNHGDTGNPVTRAPAVVPVQSGDAQAPILSPCGQLCAAATLPAMVKDGTHDGTQSIASVTFKMGKLMKPSRDSVATVNICRYMIKYGLCYLIMFIFCVYICANVV